MQRQKRKTDNPAFHAQKLCGWCREEIKTGVDLDPTRVIPEITLVNGVLEGHLDCVYTQILLALPDSSFAEGISELIRKKLGRAPRIVERRVSEANPESKILLAASSRAPAQTSCRHAIPDDDDGDEEEEEEILARAESMQLTFALHPASGPGPRVLV
jgi:hypothetical protein